MIRFETINGSLYELDETAGTWARRRPGKLRDPLAPLRDEGAPMRGHSAVRLGAPVFIYGPPLRPEADFRQIETTEVARLLEPAEGAPAWGERPTPIIVTLDPIHD